MSEESKRSSIPPCPGRILPLSFTPMVRLNRLSTKSPHVPNTATTKPNPIHSGMFKVCRVSPELAKLIRDLSGIANNVNQIAHQMHIDGFDAVKEQCLHIIAAIGSIINQVKPMRHDS